MILGDKMFIYTVIGGKVQEVFPRIRYFPFHGGQFSGLERRKRLPNPKG
jgi:hypothetical protein